MLNPVIEIKVNFSIGGIDFKGIVANNYLLAEWSKDNGEVGFSFSEIPLVQSIVHENDGIYINKISFEYKEKLEFFFDFKLILFGNTVTWQSESLKVEDNYILDKIDNSNKESLSEAINWFDIYKNIGGFSLNRVGLSMSKEGIKVYLNAGINLSILTMEFYELNATLPVGGQKFKIGMNGMQVKLNAGPLQAQGGLYRSEAVDGSSLYNGSLGLKVGNFTLSALGSYATISGIPSFFLYTYLGYPLGGPPCFFVTGLALGFGINRAILLPDIKEIASFPFVKAITESNNALANSSDATTALNTLSDWIKPSIGNYFAVAGVKFTTFNLINSFALLLVEFGTRFRVTLLGQSTLIMPLKASEPLLFVKLFFKAFFDEQTGYLEVQAVISDDSYFLSKECKLRGGMIFCAWTKGERSGDFLISLGGCHHPLFKDKDKYPQADKVGINWQINNNLSLTGNGYFAITPACAMGGINVEMNYKAGDLKAWFKAVAEFFIRWKPLFYDIKIYISVGASYLLNLLLTKVLLEIELGADLHLWGPEFAGEVTLHCYVFSVTINFGEPLKQKPIDWEDFYNSFLAKGLKENCGQRYLPGTYRFVSLVMSEGVIEQNETEIFVVSDGLGFNIEASIPCSKMSCKIADKEIPITYEEKICGILPMEKKEIPSHLEVMLVRQDGKKFYYDEKWLEITPIYKNLSNALWGQSFDPNAKLLKQVPVGFNIHFDVTKGLADNIKEYQFEDLRLHNDKEYSWSQQPERSMMQGDFYTCFANTQDILGWGILKQLSDAFSNLCKPNLKKDFLASAKDYFWDEPRLCETGKIMR